MLSPLFSPPVFHSIFSWEMKNTYLFLFYFPGVLFYITGQHFLLAGHIWISCRPNMITSTILWIHLICRLNDSPFEVSSFIWGEKAVLGAKDINVYISDWGESREHSPAKNHKHSSVYSGMFLELLCYSPFCPALHSVFMKEHIITLESMLECRYRHSSTFAWEHLVSLINETRCCAE